MIRTEETLPVHPLYIPRSPRRAARRVSSPWWLVGQVLIAILLTAGVLPAGILAGIGLLYETRHLILPGVSAPSTDLSGYTQEAASNELNLTWNYNHHLTLSEGERSWQITPVELGLFLDPASTARAAFQAGRANTWTELEQIVGREPQPVMPVVVYRPDLARAALDKLVPQLDVPAQEASLKFANGQWTAIPGKAGIALDVDATLALLAADPLGTFFRGQISLVLKPVAPQMVDHSATAARLQAFINKSFKIQIYDPIKNETIDWSVPAASLAAWINVSDPIALDPKIALNQGKLVDYLKLRQAELAPNRTLAAYQLPADLTQFWQDGKTLTLLTLNLPTTYQVVAGDTFWQIARKVAVSYWMIQNANPGVSDSSLRVGQVLNIPSRSDLLPLPVVMGKRIVISITQQHMWTYENGKLRKEYVISTGMSDSPTMPGVYQVQSHVLNAYASIWDLWMPNFLGIYQAVPGFWNGIHGLPVMSNGVRLWANVLGKPVTYGCILMDLKAGQDVYNWAQEGVVVEIDA